MFLIHKKKEAKEYKPGINWSYISYNHRMFTFAIAIFFRIQTLIPFFKYDFKLKIDYSQTYKKSYSFKFELCNYLLEEIYCEKD